MNRQSESVTELAKALVKAQAAMTPAVRDAQNPYLKIRYASLNSVLDSCREALLKNNLALVQNPAPAPEYLGAGFIGLETRLIHAESGQWISSLTVVPLAKPEPQALGAAISYARRYALSAMIGIVCEDDCDCETRTRREEPPARRQDAAPERQRRDDPPNLQGVSYDIQHGQDGREYIVATGNTREHRDALKAAGFSWNSQRSCWYRAASQ